MGFFEKKPVEQARLEGSFIYQYMEASQLRWEILAQRDHNAKAFREAQVTLSSSYPGVGDMEIGAVKSAYQNYIVSSKILPELDQTSFLSSLTVLMNSMVVLKEVFIRNGTNITKLWEPFVEGLLAEIDLIEKHG